MKHLLLATVLSTAIAVPAFADCVEDVGQIDQALAANPPLSEADLVQVRDLRDQGQSLCAAGQDDQATLVLAEAKTMLGLE